MIAVNREKCVGCGNCVEVCPQQCFTLGNNGKGLHSFPDRCLECGACKLNCSAEAISVNPGAGCFIQITKELLFGKDVADNKSCC